MCGQSNCSRLIAKLREPGNSFQVPFFFFGSGFALSPRSARARGRIGQKKENMIPPPAAPQDPTSQAMMSLAAGAGFKSFAEATNKLTQSGQDLNTLMGMPNFPMFLAGAGAKDLGNSMELVQMIQKAMEPPKVPEGPPPQDMAAAAQMVASKLGPGLQGMLPPPPGMGPAGGMPPPMGGGMPPPNPQGMY